MAAAGPWARARLMLLPVAALACACAHLAAASSSSVHGFFYLWYGTPEVDGSTLR